MNVHSFYAQIAKKHIFLAECSNIQTENNFHRFPQCTALTLGESLNYIYRKFYTQQLNAAAFWLQPGVRNFLCLPITTQDFIANLFLKWLLNKIDFLKLR